MRLFELIGGSVIAPSVSPSEPSKPHSWNDYGNLHGLLRFVASQFPSPLQDNVRTGTEKSDRARRYGRDDDGAHLTADTRHYHRGMTHLVRINQAALLTGIGIDTAEVIHANAAGEYASATAP